MSEKALSQGLRRPALLSLSRAIEAKRNDYYEALQQAQQANEITPWITWFTAIAIEAQVQANEHIDFTLRKTRLFDRFKDIFSTAGAEKRKEHGSKGALVFRDPAEDDRVWVIFDWDEEGWKSFVSDPTVPPVMKEAGHKTRPQSVQLAARCVA